MEDGTRTEIARTPDDLLIGEVDCAVAQVPFLGFVSNIRTDLHEVTVREHPNLAFAPNVGKDWNGKNLIDPDDATSFLVPSGIYIYILYIYIYMVCAMGVIGRKKNSIAQ